MRGDSWLSGFTDGEGCFYFQRTDGGRRCVPAFRISLRDDDAAVLEALRREFGGTITISSKGRTSRPGVNWSIYGKETLVELAAYFDRFPLRSKKARDFALWRRAVAIYAERGGSDPELHLIADALAD